MMEFHISRSARDRYGFRETLFSLTGNVVFASIAASRELAHRMNLVRNVEAHPERAVHSGALYTMGLIDEATHAVLARYREQFDPAVMTDALAWFSEEVGQENLDKLLLRFVEHFPGVDVYRGVETPRQWLEGSTEGGPNRAAALEEMMLLWMANRNPAFQQFEELFEDRNLAEKTAYVQVTQGLPEYFATRPLVDVAFADLVGGASTAEALAAGIVDLDVDSPKRGRVSAAAQRARRMAFSKGAAGQGTVPVTIYELLRAPALTAPASLMDQLARIQKVWQPLLSEHLQRSLRIAAEVLHEESLAIWAKFNPPSGDARRQHQQGRQSWEDWSPAGGGADSGSAGTHEYERFSADVAWMPTAVLLAKSTFVWLAQLSRQYGRSITTLDQIPDEELDMLGHRGMNSLWLIGVWERSRASKTIKQLCGNTDAVASAYSLFDYHISEDLGGDAAYQNLRDRCYRRGLRLASDMVANHMGIDSPWVVEHPEWFLSRQDSPYPAYNFEGPDLSPDPRVEIKIERHYYEQTDAAVVFRRRDRNSGETRYIYHGNDGTSFPWNDTAQLDYLNPAVREQVIQTILQVARKFPVIRFDAAMTLAKRHFHRLWFPAPGTGGAIPSRAEYSMSSAEFDRHMPHEFWREVVDRVAAEVPGTLLLAEAFWLMEGYFVRTLGMHRVYNSAFMVMLRDEDNANYRSVIKKTLEFDPDIMKRYVNFMSNPDERTTIDQFGNGDKCFGVAAMMATLPGLPMFGHGQVEGYTEKYGMEYRRPRLEENPDPWLVDRHQRQIAPLLRQRWLFAESSNFRLYDFVKDDGSVEEDVFAYSNRSGDHSAVILYNNRYAAAHGRIDNSAIYADKGSGEQRQQRLRDSLGLSDDPSLMLAYRDSLTGLEYLRRAKDVAERGLTLHLQGYQCHVLLEWRELRSTAEQPWERLCHQLHGRGVPNLKDEMISMGLRPVHDALRALLALDEMKTLATALTSASRSGSTDKSQVIRSQSSPEDVVGPVRPLLESLWRETRDAYAGTAELQGNENMPAALAARVGESLLAASRIPDLLLSGNKPPVSVEARENGGVAAVMGSTPAAWASVLAWCVLQALAEHLEQSGASDVALDLYDKLRLREPLAHAFSGLGLEGEECWRAAASLRVLLLAEAGVVPEAAAPKAPGTAGETAARVTGTAEQAIFADAAMKLDKEPAAPGVPGTPPVAQRRETLGPLSKVLWQDADVRWLTGVHESEAVSYMNKEWYEDLVSWLQFPALLQVAQAPVPDQIVVSAILRRAEKAFQAAAEAGYRIDRLVAKDALPVP